MVWMSSRQQRDLVIHEQETTVATSFPGRSRSINDPHPIRPSIVHHSPPLRLLLSSGSSAFSLPFHLPARQPVFIYNVAKKKTNQSIIKEMKRKGGGTLPPRIRRPTIAVQRWRHLHNALTHPFRPLQLTTFSLDFDAIYSG